MTHLMITIMNNKLDHVYSV